MQVDRSRGHFVLPAVVAQFRRRLAAAWMDERLALQAAAAMEQGVVSPAHLVVAPFPREPGSQRVTEAASR